MATPIRIKRSAVSGKRPQLTDLQLGELALNTNDGSLFTERDTGGVGIATTVSNLTPWAESYGASSISYLNSVGIGSAIPIAKLDVFGQTELDDLNVTGVSTFSDGINVTGVATVSGAVIASVFSGSGYSLTNLNASNIGFGTVADARISTLTASKLTGALPAISGASLTDLTGASAGTYGNSTVVPQIDVDANGRITGITNVSISGGGGGGSSIVIKDGGSVVGTAGTIDFGSNLSVSPLSSGIVTVTGAAGGGGGIAGIDTTGTSFFDQLYVTGVSTFTSYKTSINNIDTGNEITYTAGNINRFGFPQSDIYFHIDTGNGSNGYAHKTTNDNERFRITYDGNVGIGTEIPTDAVVGSGNTAILAVGIVTSEYAYTRQAYVGQSLILSSTNTDAFISETGSGNLFIKSDDLIFNTADGNTYLGKIKSDAPNPNYLEIAGNIGINEQLYHNNDTDTLIGFPAGNTFAVQTNSVERVRVANQNIYIAGNETGNNRAVVYNYSDGIGIYASPSTNHRQISLHSNGSTEILVASESGVNITGILTVSSDANFSGNVSVGGTLTYEDVTNIDSVGLITARTGIKVLAGGINAVGVITATSFSGDSLMVGAASTPTGNGTFYPAIQQIGTDAASSSLNIFRFSNDTSAANIRITKSRSTNPSSLSIVQQGDEIGNIYFLGDDGDNLNSGAARILAKVTGTPQSGAGMHMPLSLSFWTAPDGGGSPQERLTVYHDGNVGINSTIPTSKLDVDGTVKATSFSGSGANITGISTLNITDYGVGLGGGGIAGINTEGTSFFNQLSVGNSYPAGISSFFSYQHNGGLDLLVAPGYDDQSTRLRIQSKNLGGPSYDWYLESARGREQFKIIGGSTSWITIGGVSGGSGKVGINSTDPTSQLDVVGDVKISGIITAGSIVPLGTLQYDIGQSGKKYAHIWTDKISNDRIQGYYSQNIYFDNDQSLRVLSGSSGKVLIASDTVGIEVSPSTSDPTVTPTSDDTISLGTSSKKWSEVNATSFVGSGASLTALPALTNSKVVINPTYNPGNSFTLVVNANYDVSHTHYTITGTDRNGSVSGTDPTITIKVGDTVNFDMATHSTNNAGDPLYIKTTTGTGTGNQVTTPAASNQGSENGTVSWTPNTTGTYYYQNGNRVNMYGPIVVQSATGTSPEDRFISAINFNSEGRVTGVVTFNGYVGATNSTRGIVQIDDTNLTVSSGIVSVAQSLNLTGVVTATSFVKSGGTSSQYLMADGSVTTSGGGGGAAGLWQQTDVGINTVSKVGIGTTNPEFDLDLGSYVANNVSTASTLRIVGKNNSTAIRIAPGGTSSDITILRVDSKEGTTDGDTNNTFGFSLKYMGSGTGVANRLAVWPDNLNSTKYEAFSIFNDGKVALYDDNQGGYGFYGDPTKQFNLYGDCLIRGNIDINSDPTVDTGTITIRDNDILIQNGSSTDKMFITKEGHVGIGTTNAFDPVSASNTNVLAVGIVTANEYYGDGSKLTGISGGATGVSTTVGTFTIGAASTANIDSFAHATNDYKVAEYTLHFMNGANIQAQKLLVMQDGTNVYSNSYGVMASSDPLVSVGSTIGGGNVYVNVTAEVGVSGVTTYRWRREVQE